MISYRVELKSSYWYPEDAALWLAFGRPPHDYNRWICQGDEDDEADGWAERVGLAQYNGMPFVLDGRLEQALENQGDYVEADDWYTANDCETVGLGEEADRFINAFAELHRWTPSKYWEKMRQRFYWDHPEILAHHSARHLEFALAAKEKAEFYLGQHDFLTGALAKLDAWRDDARADVKAAITDGRLPCYEVLRGSAEPSLIEKRRWAEEGFGWLVPKLGAETDGVVVLVRQEDVLRVFPQPRAALNYVNVYSYDERLVQLAAPQATGMVKRARGRPPMLTREQKEEIVRRFGEHYRKPSQSDATIIDAQGFAQRNYKKSLGRTAMQDVLRAWPLEPLPMDIPPR